MRGYGIERVVELRVDGRVDDRDEGETEEEGESEEGIVLKEWNEREEKRERTWMLVGITSPNPIVVRDTKTK